MKKQLSIFLVLALLLFLVPTNMAFAATTGTTEAYNLDSPHPYANNYSNSWTISKSGASNIRVHFQYIDTEAYYDYVKTSAGDSWNGSYPSGVWSSWSGSSSINVTLSTDGSVTKNGFKIDMIEYVAGTASLAINSITTDKQGPQNLGSTIAFNISASGGSGNLQYGLLIAKDDDGVAGGSGQVVQWPVYQSSNICKWTPSSSGLYQIIAYVKDVNTGTELSSIVTYADGSGYYSILPTELKINSITTDKQGPQSAGSTIAFNINASGGSGNLQYGLLIAKDDDGVAGGSGQVVQWPVYQSLNICNWTPSSPGLYQIIAYVKDVTTGTELTSIVTYADGSAYYSISAGELKINSVTTNRLSPQTVGSNIAFTINGSGGSGNLQYGLLIVKDDDGVEGGSGQVIQWPVYQSSNVCYWTPSSPGLYEIIAYVKDVNTGNTTSSVVTYSNPGDAYFRIY